MSRNFKFKQFTIYQQHSAMKLSTDSVLLGAWADCEGAKTVLDIGTGTGILSLMIAQRYPQAQIYAIDIDASSLQDARQNFEQLPWSQRITAILGDVRTYRFNMKFDCIISNPPYFQNALKPSKSSLSVAKHDNNLDFGQLAQAVNRLLQPQGKANIVVAHEFSHQLELNFNFEYLFCHRRLDVFSNVTKNKPRLSLLMFLKKITDCNKEKFYISDHNGYTNQYKNLTKDFYLFF